MQKRLLILGILVSAFVSIGHAQQAAQKSAHVMVGAAEMKWGEVPPSLPKGAQLAVVAGDPGKSGFFTVRLKMPAGYQIKPHWHPTDEHITVLSGTFALGMGEKFDPKQAKGLGKDGYALLPAEMRHFAIAKTAAVVQVAGPGPFVVNYVNPADDPSKGK